MYLDYLKFLENSGMSNILFAELTLDESFRIIVDECQDFSNKEISNLIKIGLNKRCIFLFGGGQNLNDNLSNTIFLKSKINLIKEINLTQTFRCPKNIMFVANKVHELMLALTPKQKFNQALSYDDDIKSEYIGVWRKSDKIKYHALLEKYFALAKEKVAQLNFKNFV